MTQPQLGVYLSHSSHDNTFAQKLAWALRGAGAETWFDPHVRDSSTPGFAWREAEKRHIFVVVVSQAALASAWVIDELKQAAERYKRSLEEMDRLSARIRRSDLQYVATFEENRFYLQRHIVPVVIDALTEVDFTGEWRIVWDILASKGPLDVPQSEE